MEYVKMAVQSIRSNKGRSFLTMLGIIIGIASVIMIMAVGNGTTNAMNSTMDSIAGGQIYVFLGGDAMSAEVWIDASDLAAVKEFQGVEGISTGNGMQGETTTGKGEFSVNINGNTEDGLMLEGAELKYGSYITESDIQSGSRVCVISSDDAKRLFGSDDVIGMEIDVIAAGLSISYRIKGITMPNSDAVMMNYSYGETPVDLTVPYSQIGDYYSEYDTFSYLLIQTDKTMDSAVIASEVVELLERRHDCVGEEYFQIQNFQDILGQMNEILAIMTIFISVVAGISLLVGGIGVMNIMLVSVTERTREIGIRKSLGARTGSIKLQFLAESAFITIIGGVIGILLGLGGAFAICSVISGAMDMEIIPGLSAGVVLGATFFSAAVGIFFGIYPASKAAKLSPIEALRRN